MNRHKTLWLLLPLGLLLMSCTYILSHFIVVPDALDGFLKGVGIGLMILSLVLRKYKPAC